MATRHHNQQQQQQQKQQLYQQQQTSASFDSNETAATPMSSSSATSIEALVDRILAGKNWSNILFRNVIRDDIQLHGCSGGSSGSGAFNERRLVEHMHELDGEQLAELRRRVFKLARDHHAERVMRAHMGKRKPVLKQEHAVAKSYAEKCAMMRDVVECLEFVTKADDSDNDNDNEGARINGGLPERCTSYDSDAAPFTFPLGRKSLLAQLNAIKTLRVKVLKHQRELMTFRRYADEMERLEAYYKLNTSKFQSCARENRFLRVFATSLLVVLICVLVLFVLTQCATSVNYADKRTL